MLHGQSASSCFPWRRRVSRTRPHQPTVSRISNGVKYCCLTWKVRVDEAQTQSTIWQDTSRPLCLGCKQDTVFCERTWSELASWILHSAIAKKQNRRSTTSSRTVSSGGNRDTIYCRRMSQPPTSHGEWRKTCAAPSNSWQHVDWGSKHGWLAAEEEERVDEGFKNRQDISQQDSDCFSLKSYMVWGNGWEHFLLAVDAAGKTSMKRLFLIVHLDAGCASQHLVCRLHLWLSCLCSSGSKPLLHTVLPLCIMVCIVLVLIMSGDQSGSLSSRWRCMAYSLCL